MSRVLRAGPDVGGGVAEQGTGVRPVARRVLDEHVVDRPVVRERPDPRQVAVTVDVREVAGPKLRGASQPGERFLVVSECREAARDEVDNLVPDGLAVEQQLADPHGGVVLAVEMEADQQRSNCHRRRVIGKSPGLVPASSSRRASRIARAGPGPTPHPGDRQEARRDPDRAVREQGDRCGEQIGRLRAGEQAKVLFGLVGAPL